MLSSPSTADLNEDFLAPNSPFLPLLELKLNEKLDIHKPEKILKTLVMHGQFGLLRSLLENSKIAQIHVASEKNFILGAVCLEGYEEFFEYLLQFDDVVKNISAKSNRAIRFAARNGHTNIVKRLLEYTDIKENICVKKNLVLTEAAYSGKIEIIEILLGFEELKDNIAKNYNEPLVTAARKGHFDIVKLFLSLPHVKEKINFNTFEKIIFKVLKNNYLPVINLLLDEPTFCQHISFSIKLMKHVIDCGDIDLFNRFLGLQSVSENLTKKDNAILNYACKKGGFEVVNALLGIDEVLNTIHDNTAICIAARKGYSTLVKQFLKFTPIRKLIENDPFPLLLAGIESNNIDLVFGLLENVFPIKQLAENDNAALLQALRTGNRSIFSKILSYPHVFKEIEGREQLTLEATVQGGNVNILKYFLEFPKFLNVLEKHPSLIIIAARYGHNDMLYQLLTIQPIFHEFCKTSIASNVLSTAIEHDHIHTAKYLLQYDHIISSIDEENSPFYFAIVGGHLELVDQLSTYPIVLSHIPTDINEAIVNAPKDKFYSLLSTLLEIPAIAQNIHANNNYILFCAIKRQDLLAVKRLLKENNVNEQLFTDTDNIALTLAAKKGSIYVLNALLEIPQIFDRITANDNAAFRAAADEGNIEIIKRLNEFKAVREYKFSLASLANFRENSMRALDEKQLGGIFTLKKYLKDSFLSKGSNVILSELKDYLIEKYLKIPVTHKEKELPFEYNDALTQEAQTGYYQNIFHSAYRYLFLNPNPWISSDATVALLDSEGAPLAADIPEDQREIMAYIWLAITKEAFPLPDGYTIDDLKEYFVRELSALGRRHNWDTSRMNAYGKNEEYDDLEKDKPSCSAGIAQGIAQVLEVLLSNFSPEFKVLTPGIIKRNFMAIFVANNNDKALFDHLMKLNFNTLNLIEKALENLVVVNLGDISSLDEEEKELLKQLTLSDDAIQAFILDCQKAFSTARISHKSIHAIKWVDKIFDTYEQFIHHLANNVLCDFYNELQEKINQLKQNFSKDSVSIEEITSPNSYLPSFSEKRTTENIEEPLPHVTSPKLSQGNTLM